MRKRCSQFREKSKDSRLVDKDYGYLAEKDWESFRETTLKLGKIRGFKHDNESVLRDFVHDVIIFSKEVEIASGRWKEGQSRKMYVRGSSCNCRNCLKGGENCFNCLRKDLYGEWIHIEVVRQKYICLQILKIAILRKLGYKRQV